MKLVIHPTTKGHLDSFTESPPHAILLVGPTGIGKSSVAQELTANILGLDKAIETNPYVKTIKPVDNRAIGIDAVREIDDFLKLKVPSEKAINRVVIIEDSHQLTLEAQNALLKTLEEPPTGTVLILTAHNAKALLPTIVSRLQIATILPPASTAIKTYFGEKYPESTDIDRAYAMSGGLPGLFDALLSQDDHPLLESASIARVFIQGTSFDRIRQVDGLAKQKQLAENVLFILQQMAHVSLQTAQGTAAKRWERILAEAYNAYEELQKNGQPKLVLTRLALHI
jgi:hypothetical protein